MATNNVKPIVAVTRVSSEQELQASEQVHEARRRSPVSAGEDVTTLTGQFSLEGVTAYYSVKHGNLAVFQLVENATGKVIREVAPEAMLRLSGAIDEILNHDRARRTAAAESKE